MPPPAEGAPPACCWGAPKPIAGLPPKPKAGCCGVGWNPLPKGDGAAGDGCPNANGVWPGWPKVLGAGEAVSVVAALNVGVAPPPKPKLGLAAAGDAPNMDVDGIEAEAKPPPPPPKGF